MSRLLPVLAGVCALAWSCAGLPPAAAPAPDATLLVAGDVVLARADSPGVKEDVGGLSGAYYDPRARRLYAVSDDRDRPRLLEFDVQVAPAVALTARAVIPLERPPPGRRTLDAEGVAPAPGGGLFISSEGDPADPGEPLPGVYEYTRAGRFVRSLPLPRAYTGDGDRTGLRPNAGLEGLSVSPGERYLFAATESSLRQDGPEAGIEQSAVIRVLVYDLRRPEEAPREYAYRVDPLTAPGDYDEVRGNGGVADVLALSDTELLVMERSFVEERATVAPRVANTIRLYRATIAAAAEVTGRESLEKEPPAAVLPKRLALDMSAIAPQLGPRLRALDNFEALSFGPRLPGGAASLLVLSDDNFSRRQVTGMVVLRWTGAASSDLQQPPPREPRRD